MKKYYFCKRLRMLDWLVKQGYYPVETMLDLNNPRYKIWKFEWTDDFDKIMNQYFTEYLQVKNTAKKCN